jgi:cell division protein FtsB
MAGREETERRVRTVSERRAHKGHGTLFYVLAFITAALVLNVLFGDHGVLAMIRAHHELEQMQADLAHARDENARLREDMRRLYEPATIEDVARNELGLIKRGEVVFIIKDLPAAGPRK